MPIPRSLIPLAVLLLAPALHGAQAAYDRDHHTWTLASDQLSAIFQLTADGTFVTQSLTNLKTGDTWSVSQPGLPVTLTAGSDTFDAHRQYLLVDQYAQKIDPGGIRQYIVLQDLTGVAQITLMLEVYDNQPVLRYSARYRNTGGVPVYVTSANMMAWKFAGLGRSYTAFRVNQWSTNDSPGNFEPTQAVLATDGTPMSVDSGAFGPHCGWLAVLDSADRGLFLGWEFDGRATATVSQSADTGTLQLAASVLALNHPVPPAGDFEIPSAFIGLFHSDFDEAGHLTQQFVDAVLAKPAPGGPGAFPYVAWDSWGYTDQIDEQILRRSADVAARMGVELFVVDLGWARAIGDWYADDAKFPHGLKALSDYVHSLGMKFGLHFPLTQADPASPVLEANPDWTATEDDDYFGTSSLCLSNQPARDWLIQQGIRMIDDYGLDWILQDGANMVKQCTKTTHTHDPADSNYSNAVDGLNAVVSAIQAARPNVLWENCENGGNMMTFNMVKSYVTSITNDASGALDSRRAVYGATYPFPPRFTDRYMPDTDGLSSYATHSYMFGGPWVLMNEPANLLPNDGAFLTSEIQNYKDDRASISGGKVYHIAPPAEDATDAIESYNSSQDTAIAVITRAASDGAGYVFKPQGLIAAQAYRVWFEINPVVFYMSGSQLMSGGVNISLPTPYSSEIAHIEPSVRSLPVAPLPRSPKYENGPGPIFTSKVGKALSPANPEPSSHRH